MGKRRKPLTTDTLFSLLIVVPSVVLVGIFVYGFIGWTGIVSLVKWNSVNPDFTFVGLRNYVSLFDSFRFQSDLRNMIFFSILFIAGVIVLGQGIALLLEARIKGKWLFRNIFLFPMAMSFVVTGVVWRWLFNPQSGINLFLSKFGIAPGWYTDISIFPGWKWFKVEFGLPVALIPVLVAAIWQMTGFSLAMYVAGLGNVPEELKEAASIDGASKWKIMTKVLIPQLRPITFGLVLIMFQISLKIFDLVYTMTGSGPNFVTDMPAVYMYETTFRNNYYAEGAAISMIMLLIVMIFIIPYLSRQRGED
ncbi:carbohydrate ABC transporter permease [Paenibacillus sanguinis]|uniref:carbohydrate ABC transporter permease n=1 Tax=Paenibacillus sanguinis TaxID=225906 RepID=UPI000377AC60|nr:sugar ABC transporter permease [Paenibacillus sanguinis]